MYTTRNRVVAGSRKILALGVLLAATLVAVSPAQASTTFTVINTDDSGVGSLRQAMFNANVTPGADVIDFNIAGSGVKTITPTTALPKITGPVTINGYSQPGAEPNTKAVGSDALLKVEISGFGGGAGLVITGSNSTIKGLVINRSGSGIRIDGPTATGNRVVGNYLGTDVSGTQDLGNDAYGLTVDGANNTIGGEATAARNVISGNDRLGILFEDTGGGGNEVVGNYVGTDKNGTAPLGNSSFGIAIDDINNNTIGGTTAAERNVISGNLTGVSIYGPAATGNRVLSNSIFSNAGLGIDLGADGTTANDPGDPDTGPNNLQNKPVISSAKKGATGTTTVRGKLNSTPGKTFTVQFFSNPEGTDEGKTLLGSESVKTDGTGNFSFVFSTKKVIRLGQNITATATGADGTSEFSAPRKVVAQ
jgi:trimeric autotransporter adhesin